MLHNFLKTKYILIIKGMLSGFDHNPPGVFALETAMKLDFQTATQGEEAERKIHFNKQENRIIIFTLSVS
ncbi:MAG: hypothetical protein DRP87_10910 [Spirochaetes bacterium]|nr:MAG: hypothetical protein DRP87_10910 [Spirochaetota bacterium]